MFDEEKLNVSVNMTGTEYIKYKEMRRKNLKPMSKEMKRAMPYFVGSAILLLFLLFYSNQLAIQEQPQSNFEKATESATSLSWDDIAKLLVMNYGLIIILLVGLAWVLHGFGFFIIKV